MESLGTGFRHELVDQADVGECSSGHDVIVAATGTVGIEVTRFQPLAKGVE